MKLFRHLSLVTVLLSAGIAATSLAASLPALQVKVSRSGGKVVYEGETNSSGAFSTHPLAPGNYVVQFNAKTAPTGGPLSLVIEDTGKGSSVAEGIAPGKFARGGIAMKVEVGPKAMSLTGHISHGAAAAKSSVAGAATAAAPKDGVRVENGKKVKYEKGKKFVWVEGISAMGGHWALADTKEAQNADVTEKQAPGRDSQSDR